jgi:hypothetical protein
VAAASAGTGPAGKTGSGSSGGGAGDVEPKRPWDALQLHGADLGERHRPSLRRVDDLLADQHLAGPGVVGDPRREVHGPAEVVTVLEHHRPRVDPDVRRWKVVAPDHLDHLKSGRHGSSRLPEVEHHAVAEPLHRRPPVRPGGPPDQGGQPGRQIRRRRIPPLLGQPREPGDVEEAHCRRPV